MKPYSDPGKAILYTLKNTQFLHIKKKKYLNKQPFYKALQESQSLQTLTGILSTGTAIENTWD